MLSKIGLVINAYRLFGTTMPPPLSRLTRCSSQYTRKLNDYTLDTAIFDNKAFLDICAYRWKGKEVLGETHRFFTDNVDEDYPISSQIPGDRVEASQRVSQRGVLGDCSGDSSRYKDTGICRREQSYDTDRRSPKDRGNLTGTGHGDQREDHRGFGDC